MSQRYAVVKNGVVEQVIVADAAFIASLPGLIVDDSVDTGDLSADALYVRVDDKDPEPAIGWTRGGNGHFYAPEPVFVPEVTIDPPVDPQP